MALIELFVENLAVIERIRLRLGPGFTVLTGETGAGKSLVVDALALALGARAASDQVRSGADAARVEAVFDGVELDEDVPLADLVAEGEGQVIIRREVTVDGRSQARVNDRTVTVGSLSALGEHLAEIHGQHEQQRLLMPDRQLALLDRHGDLGAQVGAVGAAVTAWRGAGAAAAELLVDPAELARRVELLEHQASEISAAALVVGEEVDVEQQLRAATHAEDVVRSAGEATDALTGDHAGIDALRQSAAALERAAGHDSRFADAAERAAALVAEATELARDTADAAAGVDLDPAARSALDERLSLLHELRRKYGPTIEDVIAFGERAAGELALLADQEGLRSRLRDEEEKLRAAALQLAAELHDARAAVAERLVRRVNEELPALGLPHGAFGAELESTEIGPSGGDRVTFTFAPNAGEPARPLSRIASGGEASRVSLALKVVLAEADETPLLIFDEVDAGVGGRHASGLGQRLRALAAFHQVVCVTHLPQVAAQADAHLHIGKRVTEGRTVAEVTELDAAARAKELAAMLAGDAAGEEAHAAAEALLRKAAR
jgi:DNA repair protein RecN (Recombination protein N)